MLIRSYQRCLVQASIILGELSSQYSILAHQIDDPFLVKLILMIMYACMHDAHLIPLCRVLLRIRRCTGNSIEFTLDTRKGAHTEYLNLVVICLPGHKAI